jgi:hypothetical protein
MNSGSWASYQSALPIETRAGGEPDDDQPKPGRHDHEGPAYLLVEWFQPVTFRVANMIHDDHGDFVEHDTGRTETENAPVHRWFPTERWAWKHAEAWRAAMAKRHRSARIEEVF